MVAAEESIDHALLRLKVSEAYEFKRWSKKRYGYFEKPSVLRRKARKMARIWRTMEQNSRPGVGNCKNRLHLFIGLQELFARTGPSNQAGR